LGHACLVFAAVIFFSLSVQAAAGSSRAANATPPAQNVTVDPDELAKASADAVTVVTWLGPDQYRLDVQNTSGIGFINTFDWVPPKGMTVESITSTTGGQCGVQGNDIHCQGNIAPPDCTCRPGGDMSLTFTAKGLEPTYANGYWTHYGIVGSYLQIDSMTPVPYHIPSYLQPPTRYILPVCKSGQRSTTARPCAAV
jgi:hypothetical protein